MGPAVMPSDSDPHASAANLVDGTPSNIVHATRKGSSTTIPSDASDLSSMVRISAIFYRTIVGIAIQHFLTSNPFHKNSVF